jgi:exosortase J
MAASPEVDFQANLTAGPERMSTVSNPEITIPLARPKRLSQVQFAAMAAVLAVLGLSTIWPTALSLWTLWTTDALKSIGMMIPVVSLALILRAWRGIGWESEGTWWGLVLLLTTMAAVHVREQAAVVLVISPQWAVFFPPLSLVAFAYVSGVVLLFGGSRLYRAALFPIVLMWFVNPIPHVFNVWVDLPLQHASAHIARAFAMNLGHKLTPDHLRLMFTPEFGMFIAPGCNGIRGSITMGFIALIAGYVYRFRWYANALVVVGAILLGYVFNLARLCLLVLYYMVALHFPSLQDKAENADYVIGAALFLCATMLLFNAIHRLRDSNGRSLKEAAVAERGAERAPRTRYARLAAMAAIGLIGWAGIATVHGETAQSASGTAPGKFPERLGNYTLVRTWNETVVGGQVVYVWAEYSQAGGRIPITMGVSPVLGSHDPLICHSARGDDPVWQGQVSVATAGDVQVAFSSALFSDGVSRSLEASTICNGSECGEFVTGRPHFGFVYSRPDARGLLSQHEERPIPVLLRVESLDATESNDMARDKLTGVLRDFLASVRVNEITQSYANAR